MELQAFWQKAQLDFNLNLKHEQNTEVDSGEARRAKVLDVMGMWIMWPHARQEF